MGAIFVAARRCIQDLALPCISQCARAATKFASMDSTALVLQLSQLGHWLDVVPSTLEKSWGRVY